MGIILSWLKAYSPYLSKGLFTSTNLRLLLHIFLLYDVSVTFVLIYSQTRHSSPSTSNLQLFTNFQQYSKMLTNVSYIQTTNKSWSESTQQFNIYRSSRRESINAGSRKSRSVPSAAHFEERRDTIYVSRCMKLSRSPGRKWLSMRIACATTSVSQERARLIAMEGSLAKDWRKIADGALGSRLLEPVQNPSAIHSANVGIDRAEWYPFRRILVS